MEKSEDHQSQKLSTTATASSTTPKNPPPIYCDSCRSTRSQIWHRQQSSATSTTTTTTKRASAAAVEIADVFWCQNCHNQKNRLTANQMGTLGSDQDEKVAQSSPTNKTQSAAEHQMNTSRSKSGRNTAGTARRSKLLAGSKIANAIQNSSSTTDYYHQFSYGRGSSTSRGGGRQSSAGSAASTAASGSASSTFTRPLSAASRVKARKITRKQVLPMKSLGNGGGISTTDMLWHNGILFCIGDVVNLVDETDGQLYYARIRGFVKDQFCGKFAVLSWLLPKPYKTPYRENAFINSDFIVGPEDDSLYEIDCLEFVCHWSDDKHDDLTTKSTFSTTANRQNDELDPSKQFFGVFM